MTRDPHLHRWTAEEVQQLRELAASRAPARVIASKLRRTLKAIRHKAKNEGIALAGRRNE
jgi:hypothetical protein